MANSLRAKLSKLRHDGHITDAEYQELIKKLDGHDAEIYNRGYNQGTIDRAEEVTKAREQGYAKAIDEVIMQLEAEVESSAKFIREYDDSIAQKAYYKGLSNALKIVEEMRGAE